MRRLILTAALLVELTAPAWADFESGLAAYTRGDYETALEAQFNLGVMYHIGEGVPRDYVQAMQWYRLAAEQEHIGAQYNLGLMYAKGQGVSQDHVEAANWYRRAAEQNDGISQSTLGIMYTKGYGVPQDFVRAHMWLSLAASNLSPGYDHDTAVRNREYVISLMTPAEIAEAQQLARKWKPTKE